MNALPAPAEPRLSPLATAAAPIRPASDPGEFSPFGEDGLTFFDVLDVINPLQHIPVVSTLYRELSGDQIDPVPRIGGGALFGGVVGAISALVNVVVEAVTGRDIGGHLLALAEDLTGWGDGEDGADPAVAAGSAAPPAAQSGTALPVAVASPPAFVAAATGPDAFDILDRVRRERAYASVLTAARTASAALDAPRRAGEHETAIRGLPRLSVDA